MTRLKWFHAITGALIIALGYLQVAGVFREQWAGYAMGVIGALVAGLQYLNTNVPNDDLDPEQLARFKQWLASQSTAPIPVIGAVPPAAAALGDPVE